MNWIHIPSVCGGKLCEHPEVVTADISIIHGHPHTKIVLVSKRLLKSKSGVGEADCLWVCEFEHLVLSGRQYAADKKVWLLLLVK